MAFGDPNAPETNTGFYSQASKYYQPPQNNEFGFSGALSLLDHGIGWATQWKALDALENGKAQPQVVQLGGTAIDQQTMLMLIAAGVVLYLVLS